MVQPRDESGVPWDEWNVGICQRRTKCLAGGGPPGVGLSRTLAQLNDVAFGVASIAHGEARTLPCGTKDESAEFLGLLLGRRETCNSEERLDGLLLAGLGR